MRGRNTDLYFLDSKPKIYFDKNEINSDLLLNIHGSCNTIALIYKCLYRNSCTRYLRNDCES